MADDVMPHTPVTGWDAEAEIAVGLFIQRYLAAHKPPDDAAFSGDLFKWSEKLIASGQAHLVVLEEAVA